jgi:hypothetical protein
LTDDLSSIPGMRDRHRQVLAEQLHVTTVYGLVLADRHAIIAALKRSKMRRPLLPTLEEIAEWQDHARRFRAGDMTDGSDWDRFATFVVSFEERGRGRGRKRQLVVEQTELEPERPPRSWPGWDCKELCQWMTNQLGLADADLATSETASTGSAGAAAVRRSTTRSAIRPTVRVEQLALIGPAARVELATDDPVRLSAPIECTLPCRLAVAAAGSDPDQEIQVLVRFHRPNQFGWSPLAPVTGRGRSRAEFDLSVLGPGRYEASVVAWVPSGSADPHVVKLPALVIATAEV